MAQILCASHLKICRIRATRLDENCLYAPGPDNSVTTTAAIRLNIEPEIEEGEEIIQKNGCGEICINIKDPDEVKRLNAELELCLRDLDLLNILTCSESILNEDGDAIGSCRSTGVIDCPGAALEIWVQVGRSTGSCGTGEDAEYNWVRYFYPKVNFTQGGNTFENGLNNLILTGTVEPNPNALDGPFSDLGYDVSETAVECWAYETEPPPAADCGYGEPVPEDANEPTAP